MDDTATVAETVVLKKVSEIKFKLSRGREGLNIQLSMPLNGAQRFVQMGDMRRLAAFGFVDTPLERCFVAGKPSYRAVLEAFRQLTDVRICKLPLPDTVAISVNFASEEEFCVTEEELKILAKAWVDALSKLCRASVPFEYEAIIACRLV